MRRSRARRLPRLHPRTGRTESPPPTLASTVPRTLPLPRRRTFTKLLPQRPQAAGALSSGFPVPASRLSTQLPPPLATLPTPPPRPTPPQRTNTLLTIPPPTRTLPTPHTRSSPLLTLLTNLPDPTPPHRRCNLPLTRLTLTTLAPLLLPPARTPAPRSPIGAKRRSSPSFPTFTTRSQTAASSPTLSRSKFGNRRPSFIRSRRAGRCSRRCSIRGSGASSRL